MSEATKDDLMPSPFCGSADTYLDDSADCTGTPMAGCMGCGAHIPSASREKVVAEWNCRAAPPMRGKPFAYAWRWKGGVTWKLTFTKKPTHHPDLEIKELFEGQA